MSLAAANIVATTVTTGAATIVKLNSIANVTSPVQIPFLSYSGTDPYSGFTLGTHPGGYTVTVVDNPGNGSIDLSIVPSVPSVARITSVHISGVTLSLQGTNGPAGAPYVLLGSTNVALPLTQWTPLLTNSFAPDGSFNLVTNIVNPAQPREFYILKQ